MAVKPAQTITPFPWFDAKAEEAANFYVFISRIRACSASRVTETVDRDARALMTVSFVLDGQQFTALNGGPSFQFTPAISFVVDCITQREVDEYWEKLSAGGKPGLRIPRAARLS